MQKRRLLAGAVLVLIGVVILVNGNWGNNRDRKAAFEKTWTFGAGELNSLNVKSDDRLKVSFEQSRDGTNKVYLKGEGSERLKKDVEAVQLSSGNLEVDLREKGGFWSWFQFGFHWNDDEEIIVSLTDEARIKHLALAVDSGSVTVLGAQVDTADISSDSGSVTIEDVTAGRLTLNADSGSIKGARIHADADIHADSGSIKLDGFTGPARIKADSGSVKLYKEDTSSTEIDVDSGSVYVHLPASFAGSFDLKADSGSVKAPPSKGETQDLIKVRTDSGSINIEQ